ncbi:hypothetical protein D3C81_1254650 [compost metagenome]
MRLPIAEFVGARIDAAIAQAHLLEFIGQQFHAARRVLLHLLAGLQQGQADLQLLRLALAADFQRMHIRAATAEVIRHIGDEAHLLRVTAEDGGSAADPVGFHRQWHGRRQAPTQEAFHAAHAFVLAGDGFTACADGQRRTHDGERQRHAGGQQHGGQQHFDQGETAHGSRRPVHGAAPPATSSERRRNVRQRSCSCAVSPQRTCRSSCHRRELVWRGSTYGAT